MRNSALMTAVAIALCATTACKKADTDNNLAIDSNMSTGMTNNDLTTTNGTTAMAMTAQQFTDTVAGSDMFEIQSGKLAETSATTPALKDLAKMLVTDHTKSSDMLKAAAKKTSPVVALPLVLPADLKAKIDALKAAKGADFDKLYVEQQTAGHQAALDALKAYSSGGDQASLKDFATNAVPVVQGHLDKLSAMKM